MSEALRTLVGHYELIPGVRSAGEVGVKPQSGAGAAVKCAYRLHFTGQEIIYCRVPPAGYKSAACNKES